MDSFPTEGRLAGIDFGTVRVGIAVCDAGRIVASPFETYQRQTVERDEAFFNVFVKEESIVGFIVGLPLHTSGDESQKSAEARQFAEWLRRTTTRPIRFVDERFSTAQANQLLSGSELTAKKKKARLDKLAAQIILSTYLESPDCGSDLRSLDDR